MCRTARWATSPRTMRYGVDARPTDYANTPATFDGIRRPDGRVATRNYIGILTSVNCSAHVAGLVADVFRRNPFTGDDPLADYPNVDGVVALTHKTGCGMTESRAVARAASHAGGLCAAREFLARGRAGAGLRGEPDPRADGGAAADGSHPQHGHPDHGRHAQDGGSGRGVREGGAGGGEPGAPRTGAGERTDRGAAMRRVGRLFRRVGQSRAGCGERSAGAAWRHGDPVGDAGDLWRRTSADAPCGVAARWARSWSR